MSDIRFIDSGVDMSVYGLPNLVMAPSRSPRTDDGYAFDRIPPAALLRLAKVAHDASTKYSADNWRGISLESWLSHAMKHISLHMAGDTTEDHLGHALANLAFAVGVSDAGA